MKRLLSLVFSLILALSMISAAAAAEISTLEGDLALTTAAEVSGDTMTFTVELVKGTPINYVDLMITYDPAGYTLVSAEGEDLSTDSVFCLYDINDETEGEVRLIYISDEDMTDGGVLFTLVLRAAGGTANAGDEPGVEVIEVGSTTGEIEIVVVERSDDTEDTDEEETAEDTAETATAEDTEAAEATEDTAEDTAAATASGSGIRGVVIVAIVALVVLGACGSVLVIRRKKS